MVKKFLSSSVFWPFFYMTGNKKRSHFLLLCRHLCKFPVCTSYLPVSKYWSPGFIQKYVSPQSLNDALPGYTHIPDPDLRKFGLSLV